MCYSVLCIMPLLFFNIKEFPSSLCVQVMLWEGGIPQGSSATFRTTNTTLHVGCLLFIFEIYLLRGTGGRQELNLIPSCCLPRPCPVSSVK